MGGKKVVDAERFSKDSSRLSPSSVPVPVHSRSMGNACRPPTPVDEESSPSERETEWKEETDEAGTCLWARRVPSDGEKSVSVGG